MNKKIDTNITSTLNNGVTTINYVLGFSQSEKNKVRIKDAVLKLHATSLPRATETGFKVFNVKGNETNITKSVIDYVVNADNNGYVCINIADELSDALSANSPNIIIEIEGTTADYINFDSLNHEAIISYTSKKEKQSGNPLHEISARRAGAGTVNLATGSVKWQHNNINSGKGLMPVKISHIYSSLLAGQKQDSVLSADANNVEINLPENFCGKGWKLNTQQYLVEDSANETLTSNKQVSKTFTYVDAEGNHQVFLEKYYYLNTLNEKQYVGKDEIEFDTEGNYKLKSSNTKVEKETITNSGLVLTSSIHDISKSYLFNSEPEELVNTRERHKQLTETIDELKENLFTNKQQLFMCGLSQKILSDQTAFQKVLNIETTNSIELQKRIAKLNHKYYRNSRSWDNMKLAEGLLGKKNVSESLFDELYNCEIDDKLDTTQTNIYDSVTNNYMLVQDVKVLMKNFAIDSNSVLTLGFDYTSDTSGNLYMQSNSNEESKKIYNKQYNFETLKSLALNEICKNENPTNTENIISHEDWERIKENSIFESNNLTLSLKDAFSLNMQIEALKKSNEKINVKIKEYAQQLEKTTLLKEQLELQAPVHYLSNSNGNIMGFGKTENKNVFRLIILADAYENAVYFNYNKENKLVGIINANEQEVKLDYKENLLLSITDERGRKTNFTYNENNLLTSITYANGKTSLFGYNSLGLLTSAVDASGYGTKLNYTNNAVTQISEISSTEKITHNSKIAYVGNEEDLVIDEIKYKIGEQIKIDYYDFKSTIVTNLKTNKSITYVLNNMGNPVTVYENKMENNSVFGNVRAVSYNKEGNKKSFTIEALQNAENMLNGGNFEGYAPETISEFYLGDDLFCGDDIYLTSYANESADDNIKKTYTLTEKLNKENMLSRRVTAANLLAIKQSGKHNFVLSGWAKADAAWVNRRLTDYCGQCDNELDDNEITNLINASADENKKQRRFELRAQITYVNNGATKVVNQFCSFNWMQTGWQYCACPVTLSEDPANELTEIKVFFDYSRNTNNAQFYGMSLREGKWEYSEYEDDKKVYTKSSESKYTTKYVYDNKKLNKSIMVDNFGKIYPTTYDYNVQGSCVRTTNHNGIVSESVYNGKGQVIKTFTYHKDEPSAKIYETEEVLNNKGETTSQVNLFGEECATCEYLEGTNLVSATKDTNGNIVSYGYDATNDTLLSTSTNVDGDTNANIVGYNCELQTKLTHNNMDYTFEYNGFGNQTKVNINNQQYYNVETNDVLQQQVLPNNEIGNVVVGQKIKETLASNEFFETLTNAEGNPTKVSYWQGNKTPKTVLENNYDTFGNLISTKDYSNDVSAQQNNPVLTNLEYDKHGRATKKTYAQNNQEVEITSAYNVFGNVCKTTEKIGNTTRSYGYSYEVSPEANLFTIELPNGLIEHPVYDKLGRVSATKLLSLNSTLYSKNYNYLQKGNHTSNVVASEWFGQNGNIKDSLKYAYDEKGNIVSVKENGQLTCSYCYDEISRLVREDNKKLGTTITFTYNKGGNILQKTEYTYTTDVLENKTPTKVNSYTYPTFGWCDQLQQWNNKNFSYDAVGNPTTYKNNTLTFSHGRRLDNYGGIGFKYNASGARISKTVLGVETQFILNGNNIISQNNGNELFFNYGLEGVSGFSYTGVGEFFYKKNIQGDILTILDNNGQSIVEYVYDASGNHKTYIRNNNTFVDITSQQQYTESGLNNKAIAEINPFRYRGYYYDVETGLYYLQSRYYDPELGRFINADALEYLDKDNFNGLNLYAYCANNPVMLTDEDGTSWWSKFWKGVGNWFKDNWVQLTVGATFIIVGAVVTFFTAGMGTAGLLAAGGALLASAKAVGISMAISAGIGFVMGGLTTGTWGGALQGFSNGLADGFMWGGIMAGASQIVSGAFKLLNPTSRGLLQNKRFDVLYRTDSVGGGTLLNFKNAAGSSRFRIDMDPTHLLHLHFGLTNKARQIHRGITSLFAILLGLFD